MFLIYELNSFFNGNKVKMWGWCKCTDILMKKKASLKEHTVVTHTRHLWYLNH